MNEKIFKYLGYILLGISALLGLLFYSNNPSMESYQSENPPIFADLLFYYFYLLFFIAIITALIFPLLFMIRNPKKAKNAAIGIGILAVIFFLSYAFSGDEIIPEYKNIITDPSSSKLIGAGLIMVYILGGISVLLALLSGFTRYLK